MTKQQPSPEQGRGAASGGSRIGFLHSSYPGDTAVQVILDALRRLDGIASVSISWNDGSQVEFSAYTNFAASQNELLDRITDELLLLPGHRVEYQGVNRVPYPVFVFNAVPGEPDLDAPRRRRAARALVQSQVEAQRGAARIIREESESQPTQPAPDPPARAPRRSGSDASRSPEIVGETDDDLDSEDQGSSIPRSWMPGRLVPPVAEPGYEDVRPRLRPARRRVSEPVRQESLPEAEEEPEAELEEEAETYVFDEEADWVIGISEEAVEEFDSADSPTEESIVVADDEWEVKIADRFQHLEVSEADGQYGQQLFGESTTGPRREFVINEEGLANVSGIRPFVVRLLNRVALLLFGPVDLPVERDSGAPAQEEVADDSSDFPDEARPRRDVENPEAADTDDKPQMPPGNM